MRFPSLVATAAVGAIALAACGSGGLYSSSPTTTTPASSASASATPMASTQTAPVTAGSTSLGPVLVDASGMTLYGRTTDTNGTPTCTGACATAWPPVTVAGPSLPSGLDAKVFSVVARPDGSYQLRAGTWPLYRFAGDAAPGDVNGQGSGGIWFAVMPTGSLNKS